MEDKIDRLFYVYIIVPLLLFHCVHCHQKRETLKRFEEKIYLVIPSLTFPLYSCSSCLPHVYFLSPLFYPVGPRHLSVLGIHALFCH